MSTSLLFSEESHRDDGSDVTQANLSTCNFYRNSRCNVLLTFDTGEQAGPSNVKSNISTNNYSGKKGSPAETTDSLTENPTTLRKRNKIRTFFQNAWKAIKRPFICCHLKTNKVAPFVPPSELDANLSNTEQWENINLNNSRLIVENDPAVSKFVADSNPGTPEQEANNNSGISELEVNSNPGTSNVEVNSNPGTPKVEAKNNPSASEVEADTNPATSELEADANPGLSKLEVNSNPGTPKVKVNSNPGNPKVEVNSNPGTPKVEAKNNPSVPELEARKIPKLKADTIPGPSQVPDAMGLWKQLVNVPHLPNVAPLVPKPQCDANPRKQSPNHKKKTIFNLAIPKVKANTNPRHKKADIGPANPKLKAGANPVGPKLRVKVDPDKKADINPANPKLMAGTDLADSKVKTDTNPTSPEPLPVPDASFFKPTTGPVHSKYDIVQHKVLGSGAYGKVYQGIRKSDGKLVAVKQIWCEKKDRYIVIPGYSKPLLTEVALMFMLKRPPISPYVIEMYDWYEESDKFTLILEYPNPCMTLGDFILCQGMLSELTARSLMCQAVQAVQHCIEHKVFHNDIHPGNILVDRNSLKLKLIDFGSGFLFTGAAYKSMKYIGAIDYCPPDVRTNNTFHAIPTNVWSLGVVLYQMVNGTLPFPGNRTPSEDLQFMNLFLSKRSTRIIQSAKEKNHKTKC